MVGHEEEIPMKVDVQREHRWLQQLVGEWTYEGEASMGPDQPVQKWHGSESVRTVGDVWVLCEGQGEMPGEGTGTTLMTLGYDPQKQRYVGTFIGSMMTYLWVYEGSLDSAEKALTLHAEGPSCAGDGTTAKYRDVIEMVNEEHRTLTSHMLGADGAWTKFMTAHYFRKG
jgi:hypothetical protein